MKFNAAFWKWFNGSVIVDKHGQPMVCYHGTPSSAEHHNNKYIRSEGNQGYWATFSKFDTESPAFTDSGWLGRGAYFTPDPDFAHEFGDRIMPVYLALKNPFLVPDDGSNSWATYWAFKEAVEGLPGLPDALKIDDKLPPPKNVEDYKGDKYTYYYATDYVKSHDIWYVLSKMSTHPRGGAVEGYGKTEREAIDNFNETRKHISHHKQNPHGFILHVIGKVIGASLFTKMLKDAGYDGVITTKGDEMVAFYPEQIKSATGNDGTWDADDPDIRSNPRSRRR